MLLDRDANFKIDEKNIYIDGIFGLADFNSKYNIFQGNELRELLEFTKKCRSTPLRDNIPEELIKEMNGRYVRFIQAKDDFSVFLNREEALKHDNLIELNIIFQHDGLIIRSVRF
ncbi:MAG: hypothetical protein EBU90_12990 [Proteobacteria bacterium]|nr:hypothetical protein [Pseudomonadota bacterium]